MRNIWKIWTDSYGKGEGREQGTVENYFGERRRVGVSFNSPGRSNWTMSFRWTTF